MSFPNQRSPVQPGQQLAGKYRVECEIGAGAMGVVVEAWHIELDQRVAIKFLYPEFASNQDAAERFRREARAVGRIESEHVAKVIDIGVLEEGSIPYYVMEYLPGRDLSRELMEHGPLPPHVAVDYLLEACEAVADAHALGIVHRDLKPANLFLTQRPNGTRLIKVLDFGISKFTGPTSRQFSLTDTSTLMGSPAYMSPEQLESSRNVDGRADIWSLGVILHELILGLVPFRGDTVMQLVRAILAGNRVPLTSRLEVPLGLEEVVARCLRQEREQRFATIDELRDALAPFSSAAASNRVLSTTPGVAPGPRSAADYSAGSAAARRSPRPPAASPRPEPHTRSTSTAWGNTQGSWGWRQTVYRRALPGVLLALVVVGGSYLGARFWSGRGQSAAPPASALQPESGAAEARAALPPSAARAPEPAAPLPVPAPGGPSPPGSNPEAEAAIATSEPSKVPSAAGLAAAGASVARVPNAGSFSQRPATARVERPAAERAPAPQGEATAQPAEGGEPAGASNAEPARGDTPYKSPGSTRRLDIPDYGGRE